MRVKTLTIEAMPIIARGGSSSRATGRVVAAAAIVAGTAAALYFARLDLTLSHYDARAHLVVARRVTDSLTPGWRQLGALWLPLPHLLNLIPVCLWWNYQTGASAVAWSIVVLGAGLGALSNYLRRHTQSTVIAIAAPLALLVNPNVLYLQSTPMTEPILIGLALLAMSAVDRWMASPNRRSAMAAGAWIGALLWTRYEGWLIAPPLVAIAWVSVWWRRRRSRDANPPAATGAHWLATIPGVAVLAFLALGRASTGRWFVSSGFFVADNPSHGRLVAAWDQVRQGLLDVGGPVLIVAAALGALVLIARTRSSAGAALLPLALLACAVLPLGAFDAGHPYRVRYMVPLLVGAWTLAASFVGALPAGLRGVLFVAVAAAAAIERPPLSLSAPMVVEAQRERPSRDGRKIVSEYLAAHFDRTPILASMGSLGHYMQEVSAIGLRLADFVHEGNGDLWIDATLFPRRNVGWVLIEERAEGGDGLAQRARENPEWLSGFSRVSEGGGLALYRRRN